MGHPGCGFHGSSDDVTFFHAAASFVFRRQPVARNAAVVARLRTPSYSLSTEKPVLTFALPSKEVVKITVNFWKYVFKRRYIQILVVYVKEVKLQKILCVTFVKRQLDLRSRGHRGCCYCIQKIVARNEAVML